MTDKNGALPKGWIEKELGEICTITSSKRIFQNEYTANGIPFYRTKEIKELANGKDVTTELFISEDKYNEVKTNFGIPRAGDMLLTAIGTIGEIYIVEKDRNFYFKDGNVLWLKDFKLVGTYYLKFALSLLIEQLKKLSNGSTYNALSIEKLKKHKIPLPLLPEQKRIVAILNEQMSAVEKARTAAEAQLQAAKTLPAAYLREVFDSPEAQKWERKTFREICISNGQYGTSEISNHQNKGVPVLRMGNIFEGEIRWGNLAFCELPISEEKKYLLNKGDIIFNRTNSAELVGKTAVFDGSRDAIFASYLIRFCVIENLANPHFISAYINSHLGREFIEENMTRAIGQVNISASVMHSMRIPIPSIDQQNQIASNLQEKISFSKHLQRSLQDQLDTIKQLPAALLRQAFNGEL